MILPTHKVALSLLFITLATAPTAIDQFQTLQSKLHDSHISGDWQANLTSAIQLKSLVNESPDSLLEVARAETHVGDLSAAFLELDQLVRMGQATDLIATSPDFAPLRTKPDFATIQSGMKANRTPISLGSTAFLLPDSGLLTEDVAYDPNSKRFFFTSIRERKIVATLDDGTASDFAKAPDNWPMMAIKVDPQRQVVWATEVAIRDFSFVPQSDWGRSALLCYDLKNGRLLRRIEGPHGSALGDMTLAANGDVIVSDGDGGGVYRLPANGTQMERLDNGDFISPQTPAMAPDGKHIFVPDYVRGIGLLDIKAKEVRWLPMDGKFALDGIDGLYFNRGTLIAVQNGTSPERVVVFALDSALARIKSETIIERSTPTLGDPTHGVIIGDDFYYIANSGWNVLDDHGNIKPGEKAPAPRVMRVHLNSFQRSSAIMKKSIFPGGSPP